MEFWLAWFHESNLGADVKAIACAAESLGYTGVALSDHVALPKEQQSRHPLLNIPYDPLTPNIEPMTTAATMAAVTTTLQFMTYSYVMGMRDPFTVAKQAAALADLSDNRFSLGITPGWNGEEMALLGHDPATRGKRFTEAIDVMRGLWSNDLFSYQGQHYNFENVGMAPRPVFAPPIFVGGNSAGSIKRAAANAGWIGMNHSVEELKVLLAPLDELSNGSAAKYVIAAEPLSDSYIDQLAALGIRGVVLMPWSIMDPAAASVASKVTAMTEVARTWK
ncbi:TIGR03619 family F420-dependent LLM class oxidoreductase [Halieaceae bacterium IMCC14734]|uniref:TIGR03619 family F420-dependent LLM class oxidoreductase n=1 Tax=Candidatus Litorirhabdus singularis TaxID=2518993 RepID=A0ABT3TFH5_9GAMM|nr:TIGR03619 family F420-dependent LLM class oxidoreductase [Candidatus Litorirhabdus singularis]MCX2980570.1 TIGR03619 family F420-dependent LLM class oxidoreductase [Candidatus Litorirhabdus singularis]